MAFIFSYEKAATEEEGNDTDKDKKEEDQNESAPLSNPIKIFSIVSMSTFFFVYVGTVVTFGMFLTTFGVSSTPLSNYIKSLFSLYEKILL